MEVTLIIKILNMMQAGFAYLTQRGLSRDRIQKILDEAQGSDIDSAIVQAELDALAAELGETEDLINERDD